MVQFCDFNAIQLEVGRNIWKNVGKGAKAWLLFPRARQWEACAIRNARRLFDLLNISRRALRSGAKDTILWRMSIGPLVQMRRGIRPQ